MPDNMPSFNKRFPVFSGFWDKSLFLTRKRGLYYRESLIKEWHIILTAQQSIRTIPPLFLDDL